MRESLELWIAWRHLRTRESRRLLLPIGLLSAYVVAVGAGFVIWAQWRGSIAEEIASGPLAASFIPPVADIAGMLGLVTLAVGLLGLGFALLAALFNLLSAIIILSVAQGCMALVVVLSLMTGLEQDLQSKIIEQQAELRISREDGAPFDDFDAVAAAVARLPEVAAASSYAEGEVMLRSPYNRQGGLLVGIRPAAHAAASNLDESIQTGDYGFLSDPDAGPWEALERLEAARIEAAGGVRVQADAASVDVEPADEPDALPGVLDGDGDGDGDDGDAADASDDGGWEDPSLEIPRLREEGAIPPAVAPALAPVAEDAEDEEGAWEDPSVEIPRLREAGVIPAAIPAATPPEGAGEDDDGGAWEDPAVEIPRLRDAGTIPPAVTPVDAPVDDSPDSPEEPAEAVEASDDADEPESAAALVPLLIGAELAEVLGVPLGARVQVITPIGRITPMGQVPSVLAVRVVGVFFSGSYTHDGRSVYAPLDRVQALLRIGDRVHGIDVKLVDGDRLEPALDAVRRTLVGLGRPELRVESWRSRHRNLFSAMFLEKVAMFVGLLFVVLVAAFGILATNLMSVLDKAQEIAILKAMGSSDRRIARVFMIEGLVVGIVGSLAGIAVGLLFCLLLARQGLPLGADNFYVQRLPVVVSPVEVVVVGLSALVIVWLSSVHPARTAARLRPVEGLKSSE
ncbi:MAG: FtsX-like permease family protein [Myxococcales bacterium]|nr:FtsX-like permease family protein [Myxococcales bacterium]